MSTYEGSGGGIVVTITENTSVAAGAVAGQATPDRPRLRLIEGGRK